MRTADEGLVIAAALSLSSSAFVLQLLAERGETATRHGGATLGVLLMQVSVRPARRLLDCRSGLPSLLLTGVMVDATLPCVAVPHGFCA